MRQPESRSLNISDFITHSSTTGRCSRQRSGREAEIWIPETGERQDASYHIKDEHTTVQIEMESQQSLFVVFRKPSVVNDRQIPEISRSTIEEINNQWEITVPAFDGNTAQTVKLDELVSWSEQDNQAIKYFSGTVIFLLFCPLKT